MKLSFEELPDSVLCSADGEDMEAAREDSAAMSFLQAAHNAMLTSWEFHFLDLAFVSGIVTSRSVRCFHTGFCNALCADYAPETHVCSGEI